MNRPISTIARDINRDWSKPNYAAVPYLEAMQSLNLITDKYYYDSADGGPVFPIERDQLEGRQGPRDQGRTKSHAEGGPLRCGSRTSARWMNCPRRIKR